MQKDQSVGPTENRPVFSCKNAHVTIERWHKFIASHWEEDRTATFASSLIMQQLVCGETMEPDLIQVFQYEKHQDKKKRIFQI